MHPFFKSSKILLWFLSVWLFIMSTIRPMSVPDEGRYADISRRMMETGDWLIPRLNDLPFMHKPPLLHWLTACLMELFGPHLWVARLVPTLSGIALMCGLFIFTKKYLNERIAQIVATICATNLLVFGSAQYVNHDLLVATWISLTVLCFVDFILSHNKRILFLGYVFCALGFLSKGLIGLLIPGMIILPWMLYIKEWKKIPSVLHPLGLLIFACIALPWVINVQMHDANFVNYFFIEQQFSRFNSGEFNNKQPWFFYALIVLVSFFPVMLINRFSFSKAALSIIPKPILSLLIWWSCSVLVFFSIPPSKLAGYILPIMAPLIILIASYTAYNLENLKRNKLQVYALPVLLFTCFCALVIFSLTKKHIPFIQTQQTAIWLTTAILAGVLVLLIASYRRHKLSFLHYSFGCLLLLCTTVTFAVNFLDMKSNRDQLNFSQYIQTNQKIVFYRFYFYDLPFLLDLKSPTYVVNDWKEVNTDSSALELKDGLLFDPDKKQYLWDESAFQQQLLSNQKLMIFAKPGSLKIPASVKNCRVLSFRNYDIYLINE
ncbi:hypothetical protein P256_01235 [Acinetobacter nectaris CIP 110549]|uniref:Glycosyltransferase RgtA/B/C/D-like domain-containing protein n=1 Tax=Acinetobacter nectaris CIP 110549 TaxID=1392540 RepID=V2TYJ4_9GAMM|nr:glycosyltransferase family 39 protein [Acinetobacter nectaris]ESK40780.1 hypothetical protein P256_01235 [Acinetobacter nectaris CIP 110549]